MLCKEYLEVDKKNTNNPIEKRVNGNQHEKVLKFLKIMGMQIKETMKYHFTNTCYSGKS